MVFAWINSAVKTVTDSIKTTLATSIRVNSPPPKPIISNLLKESVFSLVNRAYITAECWTEDPAIQTGISTGLYTSQDLYDAGTTLSLFSARSHQNFDPDSHRQALEKLIYALNAYENNLDKDTAMTDFIANYCGLMLEFADRTKHTFEDQSLPDKQSVDTWDTFRDTYTVWSDEQDHYLSNSREVTSQLTAHPSFKAHADTVKMFIEYLYRPQIPDSIVTFLLSETLGTCGLALISDIKYPFFQPLMPSTWIQVNRDRIWKHRQDPYDAQIFDIYDPSEDSQPDLLNLEKKVLNRVSQFDFAQLHTDFFKKSTGHKTTGHSSPDQRERTKEQPSSSSNDNGSGSVPPPPPPPGGQHQQQPTIPDDTSYTPDPILAFQMRDFVKHIQGLTNMEMRLDHMTRFSSTDENPRNLTKWQVRNDDSRTFDRNSRAGKMYVITFTRQHRKPIFNPVN